MEPDSGPVPLPPLLDRAAARSAALARPAVWHVDVLAYLPVVLMALLAAATGWLVRSTPLPEVARSKTTSPLSVDYEMRRFTVQRYAGSGPALGLIEGDLARHYVQDDRLDIDGVRLQWTPAEGPALSASAARATLRAEAEQVRLTGGVTLRQAPARGDGPARVFSGEQIDVDLTSGQVRSDQPMTLTEGGQRFEAQSLFYDHASQVLELNGRVRGHLEPAAARPRP